MSCHQTQLEPHTWLQAQQQQSQPHHLVMRKLQYLRGRSRATGRLTPATTLNKAISPPQVRRTTQERRLPEEWRALLTIWQNKPQEQAASMP